MKQYLLFKELGESSELARPKFLELPLEDRIKKLNVVDTGLDLLGNRVKKQPVGINYIGLCPFHVEKTPSFNLKPVRNYFKCYGCGKEGGPLALVYEIHKSITGFYEMWFENDSPDRKEYLDNCRLEAPMTYFSNKFGFEQDNPEFIKKITQAIDDECWWRELEVSHHWHMRNKLIFSKIPGMKI